MRSFLGSVAIYFLCSVASGQDGTRFVERTPLPLKPVPHTMERVGNPASATSYALPGVTRFDAGGYVGGARLLGNGPFSRGSAVATGPLNTGTFGTDFGGFLGHTGRVFLAPSANPSVGPAVARSYRTDGPRIPNPSSFRPIRKSILEAKEAGKGS
ncbi:MAG TPA: hypothetical protein VG097_17875 [Gemmata sp.]|jgi:hypothetical protein|nr:hypothetical protein [Gemmata sp.]